MQSESALVLMVPESETLVKPFRDQYDPSSARGMPAHITLLFPFKPPQEIDGDVLNKLQSCFAKLLNFDYAILSLKRFPAVLYLAVEDERPCRELTSAIWQSFPETPPYQGMYADVIPHLTVANVADEKKLNQIAGEFALVSKPKLPIHAKALEVALMDNTVGRWQVRNTFKLG